MTSYHAAKPRLNMMTPILFVIFIFLSFLNAPQVADAKPTPVIPRQAPSAEPTFPATPPSCPICQQNFGSIDTCAQAAPVLANFSMILFNPGAFLSVISCACSDTFQSAYPQCVDCFTKTNQTEFLNISSSIPDPSSTGSSILTGIHNICALSSTLLGNVSGVDNETIPTTSAAPTPTANSAASRLNPVLTTVFGPNAWSSIGVGMSMFWGAWTIIVFRLLL